MGAGRIRIKGDRLVGRPERHIVITFQRGNHQTHEGEGDGIVGSALGDRARVSPTAIFAQREDGPCYKLALPDGRDGRIQLLVERDADFLAAFSDPNARVFLR